MSQALLRLKNPEVSPEPVSKLNRDRPAPLDFKVRRPDTLLFGTIQGLEIQSGVPAERLRQLVLKELVDNALDAADAAGRPGQVKAEDLGNGSYLIEDQGDGISGTAEELAEAFSFDRPMVSTKFWRTPTRGCMGNGIRAIVGYIAACGGTLEITTRNQRVVLMPKRTGRTELLEATEADHPIGTRVVLSLGSAGDDEDLSWARLAISFSKRVGPPTYTRSASPHWFDGEKFAEILATIEPSGTTLRQLVEQLDGCSVAKAGKVAEPLGRGRTCRSMRESEAVEQLRLAQSRARPIKPEALGPIGPEPFDDGFGYGRQFGTFRHGTDCPANIPYIVETWVIVRDRKGLRTSIAVLTNRTPVVANVRGYRRKEDWKQSILTLTGAGLAYGDGEIEIHRGECEIITHITAPFIPVSSIGKNPNLSVFQEAIQETIRIAFNRSIKRLPPDPDDPEPPPEPKAEKPPSHKAVVRSRLLEARMSTATLRE